MAGKTQMPDGWRSVRLGDVAEVRKGQSFTSSALVAGNIPVIAGGTKPPYFHAYANRVGITITISASGANAGYVSVHRSPIFATDCSTISNSDTSDSIDFIYQFLLFNQRPLYHLSIGSAQPHVYPRDISSLPIPLPPLPEQRAIAAVLNSIDDAIECTGEFITATEQLRDSLLHELLTRGVPGWHTEWKEAPGIGTIPAEWEVVRLGDVAEVERGKFAHRPRNEPRFYDGNIPFIQTGDIVRANGRVKQHSQTLNELGLSISRLFPAGTVVITIAANIGETAITTYPVAFPDSLVGIICSGIDTNFLEYSLRTRKNHLNQLAPESAQRNINLEDLRPLPTPLPSPWEQQAIAAALDGVDEAIESGRDERHRLQSLKESTADALLTGRVRVGVRQAPWRRLSAGRRAW